MRRVVYYDHFKRGDVDVNDIRLTSVERRVYRETVDQYLSGEFDRKDLVERLYRNAYIAVALESPYYAINIDALAALFLDEISRL